MFKLKKKTYFDSKPFIRLLCYFNSFLFFINKVFNAMNIIKN